MYMILEHSQAGSDYSSLRLFMTDSTHLFLFLTTLFLGIGVGIAEVISGRYLSLLKETSWQLKIYSEWFFGKHLFQQVISDPEAIQLDSKQRVVLFMDIRGFTAWSERHTPQRVVTLLSRYFTTAETICNHYLAIKVKFTGDEVMAVFRSERDALGAAHALRNSMGAAFKRQGMAIGIGINKGLLMEGIIGAESIKYYDVIGDVVNTAKRIESQADGNDILVSANVVASCRSDKVRFGPPMQLELKGKAQSVTVHALQSLG
jgi:adenylate cyclase